MEEGSDPFSVEAAVMVDPAARGASDEADSAHDADSSAEALDYSGAAADAVPVAHPAAPIPREEDKLAATDAPSAAVEDNGVSTAEFLPPGGVGAVDELRDEVDQLAAWKESNRARLAERTADEAQRKRANQEAAREALVALAAERERVLAQRHQNNMQDNDVQDQTLKSSLGAEGREWQCIVDVWVNFKFPTRRDQSRLRESILRRRDKERHEVGAAQA
jgi:hypothetical protein